jgi:hypothetical protein
VPQTPDLLLSEEVSYLKQHQALLQDVWDAWEDPKDGPTSVTAPMTMAQFQKQMEARLLTRKWVCGGVVAGSIAAVAVIRLCLWRHRQAVLTYKARCAKDRTVADHTKGNRPAHPKDESKGRTDSEMAADGGQQTRDLGTAPETTVFQ